MRNLTEVSLKNKVLVWYFILVTAIGGIFCYNKLGRMEDPQFTIREMVVSAAWPGATAEEMQEQVTDKLEKKLQDTRGLDHIKSETRAGQTVIYVDLADDVEKSAIREICMMCATSARMRSASCPQASTGRSTTTGLTMSTAPSTQ